MAIEAFLINPARKRKRKRRAGSSRKIHRPVLYSQGPKHWSRGPKSRSRAAGIRINPLGEEVMIVGANPVRRRRRRRRSYRMNSWPNNSRRHAAAARKGWRRRRRGRRRSYRRNPIVASPRRRMRRIRRRIYRRNPAAATALDIRRPMSLIMPMAVGIAAKMATDKVPSMVNIVNPWMKLGVQLGVAFGGGMLLRRPLGSLNANVWTIVSAVTAVSNIVNMYLFKTTVGYLGDTTLYPEVSYSGVDAFPEENLGAYPYDNIVQY